MNIIQKFNNTCGLNGSLYLHRLYLWELIENTVQFFNLQNVYLCTLPVELTSIICIWFILESSHRAFIFSGAVCRKQGGGKFTTQQRDKQIVFDMISDLFFLVVPMTVIYFVYDLYIPLERGIWLVLTPTISLFSKLRRMAMAFYFENGAALVVKAQNERSSKINRRRQSIYRASYIDKVERLQNKNFRPWMKIMVFVSAAGYALFMFVIFLIHLVTSTQTDIICNESLGSLYNNTLWIHGCKVKIPFCKSIFQPSCDCAAIDIENHNMTKFDKVNPN